MVLLTLPLFLIIFLKYSVFQIESLITNEAIEKASVAAAVDKLRFQRHIHDSIYPTIPFYRKYSRERQQRDRENDIRRWGTPKRPFTTRIYTTIPPIFKGQRPITPRRPPWRHFTRKYRPKNGSIFKGVVRADWKDEYVRPKVDPFGNKVTPPWWYYTHVTTRKPIFKEISEDMGPAERSMRRVYERFEKKYIKPTPFAIFWTKSQMENPTIATIRPIPRHSLKYAEPSLRRKLAPDDSFASLYDSHKSALTSVSSDSEFSSLSSLTKLSSDSTFSDDMFSTSESYPSGVVKVSTLTSSDKTESSSVPSRSDKGIHISIHYTTFNPQNIPYD